MKTRPVMLAAMMPTRFRYSSRPHRVFVPDHAWPLCIARSNVCAVRSAMSVVVSAHSPTDCAITSAPCVTTMPRAKTGGGVSRRIEPAAWPMIRSWGAAASMASSKGGVPQLVMTALARGSHVASSSAVGMRPVGLRSTVPSDSSTAHARGVMISSARAPDGRTRMCGWSGCDMLELPPCIRPRWPLSRHCGGSRSPALGSWIPATAGMTGRGGSGPLTTSH